MNNILKRIPRFRGLFYDCFGNLTWHRPTGRWAKENKADCQSQSFPALYTVCYWDFCPCNSIWGEEDHNANVHSLTWFPMGNTGVETMDLLPQVPHTVGSDCYSIRLICQELSYFKLYPWPSHKVLPSNIWNQYSVTEDPCPVQLGWWVRNQMKRYSMSYSTSFDYTTYISHLQSLTRGQFFFLCVIHRL